LEAPLISIITVCYNSASTIKDTLESVASQSYKKNEHIVVDGGSTDGTLAIIRKWNEHPIHLSSEPDEGIYDAMNKGIDMAKGNIVGILNADDIYYDNYCLESVATEFEKNNVDIVFADLVYVQYNDINKIVRYYHADNFSPRKFAYGFMPPHPTVFIKRRLYEEYGKFKTSYIIAADYELLLRFFVVHNTTYSYMHRTLVKMRMGGTSTRNLKSNFILNKEILRACKENGVRTSVLKVYSKYLSKSFQLIRRP
jgi:glycosyltransferase involved in cell wall biosynthesis